MDDDILRVEDLTKSFDGNTIMNNIHFTVPRGELSAIIGPNGAGKTTLFNLITGYHLPDSGKNSPTTSSASASPGPFSAPISFPGCPCWKTWSPRSSPIAGGR
jgi:ABC-type branched-subunit amino acid transport system ATPase component